MLSPSVIASLHETDDSLPTLEQIVQTLTFQAGFNTTMVVAGTSLLGLAAGVVGVFALLRKRSLVTDALSHATLPGIALAFLVGSWLGLEGRSLPVLLLGATVTGVLGIVCIQAILRHSRLKEDAAIGIVLSVFYGAGIVVMTYIQNNPPEGSKPAGLKSFIFGQAATMQLRDVVLMSSIALVAILSTALLLKEFSLVCFNDAFAKVSGWPINTIDLLMMALVVVVTVAGLQAVGLILVIAMLIIPPVAARFWTDRLWLLVLIAGVIGMLSGYLGSSISALLPRKPAGAVIVLTSGAIFVISMLAAPARGVIAVSIRRLQLRLRIAGDHLLELAHDTGSADIPWEDVNALARTRGWSRIFRALLFASLQGSGMLAGRGHHTVMLTTAGLRRGAQVARNHMLWEQYLINYADIAPSHVDWSVDQVEHVLSPELVLELELDLAKRGSPPPEPEQQPGQHGGQTP